MLCQVLASFTRIPKLGVICRNLMPEPSRFIKTSHLPETVYLSNNNRLPLIIQTFSDDFCLLEQVSGGSSAHVVVGGTSDIGYRVFTCRHMPLLLDTFVDIVATPLKGGTNSGCTR